ncbi:hypothetical protein BV20DRAFT_557836 [Pilatotrama ljubarskyi]|nr:hypothetical protein BV20DRAFT_557836 [Pilatotrama ljubarskyi]
MMPAFRNVRRSRRLSRQPPRDPGSDEFDIYDLKLMYPDSPDRATTSATPSSPDARLPPPDETGEPEIDHEAPTMSPAKLADYAGPRTSHSRKKKPGHIPRPPNAFMIFRSELWNKEKIKSTVERDHRQISRIAGNLWNDLSEAERAPYHHLAEEAKKEHARKYPQYKYSPIYRRDKPAKRKPKHDHSDKVLRCHEVARLMQLGYEGDELQRELERRQAEGSDGHLSDSSEYFHDARLKKASRQPAKVSIPAQPPRQRRVKVSDDDEYLPAREDVPMPDVSVKEESASPALDHCSSPADEPEPFVPTSKIPDIDIGSSYLTGKFKYDPCAGAEYSPRSLLHDALSPGSSSLSDAFLGSTGHDSLLRSCSSPEDYTAPYDSRPEDASYDGGALPADAPYADGYYSGTLASELDFSEWMQYDD